MIKKMFNRTSLFVERHATAIGWVFVAIAVLCAIGLTLIARYGDPWTVITFQYGYPVETRHWLTYLLSFLGVYSLFMVYGMFSRSVGRCAAE